MLLCSECMKALSPVQEARLCSVCANNGTQICKAKWPNGRPCWGETRQGKDICRNNPECPSHPKNTPGAWGERRQGEDICRALRGQ